MARYRIYYLKESQRQRFRQAPPPSGPEGAAAGTPAQLKLKDYKPGGEIEASSPYAAWKQMREEPDKSPPIAVGDVLEADTGKLLICKYVGFEEARWLAPEEAESTSAATPNASPAPDP